MLFGYGPLGIKKLVVLEAGDGDINEMTQHLSPDAVMFCFMQVWCSATEPTCLMHALMNWFIYFLKRVTYFIKYVTEKPKHRSPECDSSFACTRLFHLGDPLFLLSNWTCSRGPCVQVLLNSKFFRNS